jgi:hypothetical protein
MSRKQVQETLTEIKAKPIRDQTRRTEARIRQLLSPSCAENSEEGIEDREGTDVRAKR